MAERTTAAASELVRAARRLEIRSRRLLEGELAGLYAAAFRGSGLDFTGFRPYEPGDEVRHIDWNVTARTRQAHVRCYREERDRLVVVAVDRGDSMQFGTTRRTKAEAARDLAAVLVLAAVEQQDRAALALLDPGGAVLCRPGVGRRHGLAVLRSLVAPGRAVGVAGGPAWPAVLGRLSRRALIFLISDFLSPPSRRDVARIAHRHDLVPIRVSDPMEREVPAIGTVPLRGGGWLTPSRRRAVNARLAEHAASLRALFAGLELDYAEVDAGALNLFAPLRALMRRRVAARGR